MRRKIKRQMTPLERAVIQQELHRNAHSRYLLRLHVLLLVDAGYTCTELGRPVGVNPITLMRWVKRYEEKGIVGLLEEGRTGRPKTMNAFQWNRLSNDLKKLPRFFGFSCDRWGGPALAEHLQRCYGIPLGLRQCQRILKDKVFVPDDSA